MKHLILALFLVAMGFNCVAKGNKGIDNNEVNRVRNELVNQVLTPMRETARQLLNDLNIAQTKYNTLKDRKFDMLPSAQEDNKLKEYLNSFSTLEEMFKKNFVESGFVLEQIRKADNTELKKLYQLIFAMEQSLNEPYDETSNNIFIKEASSNSSLLPQHRPGFDTLVSHINDYNYYMFELARLFVAADEDKYTREADVLVKAEEAEYLLQVPYTKRMLYLYIHNKGQLDPIEKAKLNKACADAFPPGFLK